MRVVDEAILDRLNAAGLGFEVHDGFFKLERDPVTGALIVPYPVPYAVYYSSIGDDDNRRLSGDHARRSVFFSFTYVGLDRWQTKGAGERIRDELLSSRLVVPDYTVGRTELLESQRVRRDDEATREDGSPLFYGVDNYAVSLALKHSA